jgi:hypothetical protein
LKFRLFMSLFLLFRAYVVTCSLRSYLWSKHHCPAFSATATAIKSGPNKRSSSRVKLINFVSLRFDG